MLEKSACRKPFRQDQRGAAVKHRECAQDLRRIPAEGAEVVEPVVRGDAEPFRQRADVEKKLAVIENDALGGGAGSRGEEDNGVIVGPRRILRFSRCAACQLVKQRSQVRAVPAAEPQARHSGIFDKVIEPEAVLVKDEARLQPFENITELVAVHLDMDGADGRAGCHYAQIADEMFDRIVGE